MKRNKRTKTAIDEQRNAGKPSQHGFLEARYYSHLSLMTPVVMLLASAYLLALAATCARAQLDLLELGQAAQQQQSQVHHQHLDISVPPGSKVRIECKLPQVLAAKERTYYWSFQRASPNSKAVMLCIEDRCFEESTFGLHLELDRENGFYDLMINNVTYELNDGYYTCHYKDTTPQAPQSLSRDYRLTVLSK